MQQREEVIAWIGSEVLPHEASVRAWLSGRGISRDQVDDVVQEAYCRMAGLEQISHIASGRAYLFRTARNIVLEQVRRARIVRIDLVAEIELLSIVDEEPSTERIVSGQRTLRRVEELIARLPEKCRRIFKLRRIDGISQKEIAKMLGITENVVESQAVRGLKLIMQALAREGVETTFGSGQGYERRRNRG